MTMITPSYLGETIEYSSLHACRSTLEDPTLAVASAAVASRMIPSRGPARVSGFGSTVVGNQRSVPAA